MAVQDVVHIVGELIGDGAALMAQVHGPRAVSAAQGARSLLADRLRQEVSYDALWEDFESDPRGTAAQLKGTLEALLEADPSLAKELDAFMQEFYWAVGPAGPGARNAPQPTSLDQRDVPDRLQMEQAEEDVGQGTYLYGNLEPGSVADATRPSVGERAGDAETVPGVPTLAEPLF